MAFNQFMHPRNIYRQKPNFEEMAKIHPEFAKYILFDSKGKAFIDYSNIAALRSLTKTLLKKDFGLDVEIPEKRLVPTLPMRLNYVLWIEDLLHHCGINYQIKCIDIGTGSCAIFPLLATTLNNDWSFVATEIDPINLDYANLNVNKNGLSDRIKIYNNVNSDTIFKHVLINYPNVKFDFLMTNPPFFEDTFNDSFENNSRNVSHKTFHSKKTNSSGSNEAIYDGGEIKFIKKIIEESLETKTFVDIYTVMIGQKKSFLELKCLFKDLLKNNQLSSFTYTELCQGNTKRWAVAWTYATKYNISNAPKILSSKSKPLTHYLKPDMQSCDYNINSIADYIKKLLINDLNINDFQMIETKKRIEFNIKSNECGWRNQRKKRREQKIQQELEKKSTLDSIVDVESTITKNIGLKRYLDEEQEPTIKKESVGEKKRKDVTDLCKVDLTYLLHCGLTIKKDKQEIYIKIITKEMSQNKDTTFQLFQYFKNKLI